MARLLEHQGKALFKQQGIPIPEGRLVGSVAEANTVADELVLPVVIKAQVLSGRRGKVGGILFADDEDSLSKGINELLGNQIQGSAVDRLLVEEKAEVRRELYMAVTADPSTRQPVGILSSRGGVDIEETAESEPASIVTAPIDISEGFHHYDAMDLLRQVRDLDSRQILVLANVFPRPNQVLL